MSMPEQRKDTIIETINRYGTQLLAFIRGRVSSDEDAEDVLQDVWYQLSDVEEPDAIDSMSGWLYRVARNKITDKFRKKKSEYLEDFFLDSDDGEIDFREILLADTRTPEDEYVKRLFWEELQEALEELPEKQRAVFIKNELEEMTLQQIADESGENIKTIISRKGYAVKYLRDRLNELYNDFLSY
jgi:RNA polymerase sigma factor (sigma-70 family)